MVEPNEKLFVVAIGASAGGLEAFSHFFDSARQAKNVAYILIQHLAPDYKSLLAELLSKHTRMKVEEAEHGVTIKSNHVYVIPPKKSMTVTEGTLQLDDKNPKEKGPNTSIDTFFKSLAETYGEQAIAVVLSGTGSDGSKGIVMVKQGGGFVVVQAPEEAKFDGMPRSSIATGIADKVLPVGKIYVAITEYIKSMQTEKPVSKEVRADLKKIFAIIERNTGCDFEAYKLPTILRRLEKRMSTLKLETVSEYIELLNAKPEESSLFVKELLIGVTKFFRDKDAFDALFEKVLTPLVVKKKDDDSIKVWVAACSTGEEAYSIAMMLDELVKSLGKNIDVKIFATDLNTQYIESASRGVYDIAAASDIPGKYHHYFVRTENSITISPQIRKLIVFAKHNLNTDPPFIKNDLITCRNMLIYVDQQLQRRIFSKFAFALNYKGHLFLGPSENIQMEGGIMTEVDRKWKIYQKNTEVVKLPYTLGITKFQKKGLEGGREGKTPLTATVDDFVTPLFFDDFGIVSFLIDQNYSIIRSGGAVEKFAAAKLQITDNLLKFLHSSLAVPVKAAVEKLRDNGKPQLERNILLRNHGTFYKVTLSARFVEAETTYMMVALCPTEIIQSAELESNETDKASEVIEVLRNELKETRFNLQTAIEELETTNEELQSNNEELLSANEELQSSNEELQSVNEELHTLNTEHQQRIKELAELNDDLNNYFRGSNIGQIILDQNLEIRKFNPSAAKMINLMDRDINRRITDISKNFYYDKFEEDIEEALSKLCVIERELQQKNGKTVLLRINSYVTNEHNIEGVLLSFIDITDYKSLYNIIEGVYKASIASIIVLQPVYDHNRTIEEFIVVSANDAAKHLFKVKSVGKSTTLFEFNARFAHIIFKDLLRLYVSDKQFNFELELDNMWFHVVAVKIPNGVALTLNDITQQKTTEQKLRKSYNEMYISKEMLRESNTNLEAKIAQRTRELSRNEERFRLLSTITNDVIIDWDLASGEFIVGDNYYKLFGYALPDVLNNREFWLTKIHPDDVKNYQSTINMAMRRMTGVWNITYRYLHKMGSYRKISDRGFFIADENGTPYRMLSSMLDITEIVN